MARTKVKNSFAICHIYKSNQVRNEDFKKMSSHGKRIVHRTSWAKINIYITRKTHDN